MSFGNFLALSFSLCLRFVSRIAFSALLGYYVDRLMGTSPWFMIAFVLVGVYLGWLSLAKVNIRKEPDA
jgi:F0F1-type ATP synthase assembly protein I